MTVALTSARSSSASVGCKSFDGFHLGSPRQSPWSTSGPGEDRAAVVSTAATMFPVPSRVLPSLVRVEGYRRDPHWAGPDRDCPCPCGSMRRARSCHAAADGSWVAAAPPALLDGPRTGYAHPSCYGAASRDCSTDLTREHWLSRGVQQQLVGAGLPPIVTGLPWLHGKTKALPDRALRSKILCGRHNNDASPLDTCAVEFFRHVSGDQVVLATDGDPARDVDAFTLLSGPLLELWFLKLAWGALASKSLGACERPIVDLKPGLDEARLADVLWRGHPWPAGWGLFARQHAVDPNGSPASVGVVPLTDPSDGALYGVLVEVGAVHLTLGLGVPDEQALPRPGAVQLARRASAGEKVLALAWPEAGHLAVSYMRAT